MTVGIATPHDSAALHVTGKARYVDDIPTPKGTLHLAFGLSPKARGTLRELDVSAVRTAKGVVAVLTADDLPFANDVSASIHDEPLLATDRVNHVGQPVFLVIADTHLNARKAARLGKMVIDEEDPILSYDAALAAESWFEGGPRVWQKGDAVEAVAKAPRRLSGRIEMGGQEHFYLEGQAAMAAPQENGDMVVHSSTQHPTEIQHKVAEAIGTPMHAIRVECRRMGGGFGGKESQGNALAVSCAVAARLTGKPCKMRYDRDDDMVITGKRHDFRIDYEVGFDERGRVQGVVFEQITRAGWAQDLTGAVADRAMLHADNAYLLPTAKITSYRLKTNMQSATAYRGFGGPQGVVGIERVMDHIAHDLGLDPVQVRKVNYYAEAKIDEASQTAPDGTFSRVKGGGTPFGGKYSPPSHKPEPNTTPYGMEVKDFLLHGMTEKLLQGCEYEARREAIAEWNANSPILKRGIAFSPVKFGISFTLTHLNQAGALVHVYADGSIMMNHGGTEMGQGLFQKVAQVASARFGVGVDQVRITATDTAKVPNTSATAASSGSDLNGMAVMAACDAIKERMAEHLGGGQPVEFAGGMVRWADHELTFAEAALKCYEARVSLSATGFYKTPDLSWDRQKGQGRPFFYFAHGAAVTEVVIDTLTGENRILRTDILHDAGKSLNPAIDKGQVEGGYVQGAGWLTTEELVWDDQGRLRTHAPSTYKIPACSDRPPVFNIELVDAENPEATIYRSKAVGEPPFMLGISAFLALSDAVAACGTTFPALDAPATPERLLEAIKRVRG